MARVVARGVHTLTILLAMPAFAFAAGSAGGAPAQTTTRVEAAAALRHSARFVNSVTPPRTPAPVTFPPSLSGSPAPLLGNFEGDVEFWDAFWAASAGIAPKQVVAPLDGWLIGVTVDGYAVSGDMPGPGGSEPFRVGVERVLPTGQLQVVSTSDPPFRLAGAPGSYYFTVGPPATGFAMRLVKGEVVSFDARGGTWAVFSSSPGSTTDDQTGKGLEQNAGADWTGTPHSGVQLDMQATEQPKVPVTELEKATAAVTAAMTSEQKAVQATRVKAAPELHDALESLHGAIKAVKHAAIAPEEEESPAEISEQTEASILHYLNTAFAEDRDALPAKLTRSQRDARIKEALENKRKALSDIRKAESLAKQLP